MNEIINQLKGSAGKILRFALPIVAFSFFFVPTMTEKLSDATREYSFSQFLFMGDGDKLVWAANGLNIHVYLFILIFLIILIIFGLPIDAFKKQMFYIAQSVISIVILALGFKQASDLYDISVWIKPNFLMYILYLLLILICVINILLLVGDMAYTGRHRRRRFDNISADRVRRDPGKSNRIPTIIICIFSLLAVGALCVAAYVYVGRKNADINVYTYEEMPAEGYSASYSKENGAVTATNTTYKTGFNTAKVWQASEGKNITGSSDIVLNVSANGESAGNVTLTAAEGYSGMYTQLNESPVYQIVDDGKEDDPATANVLYYASGHDYGDDWQTVIYEPYYEPDVAELTLTWTDNVTHRVRMFDGNWNVTGWYTFTDGTHTVQIAPGTEAVFIDAYLYDLVSITSGDIHKADTVYSGQYISILGDSYSAVTPTIWTTKYDTDDEGYSVVNRWWSTVLDDTGANLLMNASRGGRAIAHVATSEDRPGVYWTDKLHLGDVYPDTIFIFLGINDLNFDTVGTMKKNYSSMVGQIMKNYPSANIITCTYPICTWSLYDVDKYLSMNEAIRSIAREYGLLCLDLEQTDFGFGTDFANMTSSEITAAMKTMNANYLRTDDDVHHNAAGEAIIGAKAAELLREFNIVTYTVAEAQTSGYTADYYWNGNEMTVTNILDKQTKPS